MRSKTCAWYAGYISCMVLWTMLGLDCSRAYHVQFWLFGELICKLVIISIQHLAAAAKHLLKKRKRKRKRRVIETESTCMEFPKFLLILKNYQISKSTFHSENFWNLSKPHNYFAFLDFKIPKSQNYFAV